MNQSPVETASNYLKNKYGIIRVRVTHRHAERIGNLSSIREKSEYRQKLKDRDFITRLRTEPDSDSDKELMLLMNQSYYGIKAKKELIQRLKSMNLLKD